MIDDDTFGAVELREKRGRGGRGGRGGRERGGRGEGEGRERGGRGEGEGRERGGRGEGEAYHNIHQQHHHSIRPGEFGGSVGGVAGGPREGEERRGDTIACSINNRGGFEGEAEGGVVNRAEEGRGLVVGGGVQTRPWRGKERWGRRCGSMKRR